MKKQKKVNYKRFGFFGFFGFLGFRYFADGNIRSLFYFSFFAFFSYFFIGNLMNESPDERFLENSNKAMVKSAIIPMFTVFFIGFLTGYSFMTREIIIVACAFSWALTLISYSLFFAYYEKN